MKKLLFATLLLLAASSLFAEVDAIPQDDAVVINDEDALSGCIGISIENLVGQSNTYNSLIPEKLGNESTQDYFQAEFYGEQAPGTYDLASGGNENYSSCGQCLRVLEDLTASAVGKEYFQQSGTLVLDEVKTSSLGLMTRFSKGSISAKLIEVKMEKEGEMLVSKPVAGGSCLEIETAVWDTTCKGSCKEGQICGDDGCGNPCGEGCSPEKQCAADGKSCVDYSCTGISVDSFESLEGYLGVITGKVTPEIGADKPDSIYIEFYSSDSFTSGTFDLASKEENNYEYCVHCISVRVDEESDGSSQTFFQQKGTMIIEKIEPDGAYSKGKIENLRLVEVSIDSDYLHSTPVMGGACLELETAAWNTIDVVVDEDPKTDGDNAETDSNTDADTDPKNDSDSPLIDSDADKTDSTDLEITDTDNADSTEKKKDDGCGCSLI